MSLLTVYENLKSGQLSHETAAQQFQTSPLGLKIRISKWGDRIELLLKTLDQIDADRLSRNDASKLLNITPRAVNKLMQSWIVSRPLKEYRKTRAKSQVKWDLRKAFALQFIRGVSNLEKASESASVSERQMRRWVISLLKKFNGLSYQELNYFTLSARTKLADDITASLSLEAAVIKRMQNISSGLLTLDDEALFRIGIDK